MGRRKGGKEEGREGGRNRGREGERKAGNPPKTWILSCPAKIYSKCLLC